MAKKAGGNHKVTSEHQKGLYKLYKDTNRREKNKVRKLSLHMKKHPKDLQASQRRIVVFPKQLVFTTKKAYSSNYLQRFR